MRQDCGLDQILEKKILSIKTCHDQTFIVYILAFKHFHCLHRSLCGALSNLTDVAPSRTSTSGIVVLCFITTKENLVWSILIGRQA